MIVSQEKINNEQLELINEIIEKVPRFKYLGSWINEDMNLEEEIKVRIAHAATSESAEMLCLITASVWM